MSKIITIGREFGSGGREIGKRLAEKLNIAYYDKEIVTEIAKKTELAESYIQQVIENRPLTFFPVTTGRSFYLYADPILEQNNSIYAEQNRIIREMADKSDCVIVGRCADYILQERNPLRLFIYADLEFKMNRCRMHKDENEDMTDKELKHHIREIDKNRAKYYQFYTGQTWGDKENYDLCINTTHTPIEEIVEGISYMLTKR